MNKPLKIALLLILAFSLKAAASNSEGFVQFFPDINGWESEKAIGADTDSGKSSTISVSRTYKKDNSIIDATLVIDKNPAAPDNKTGYRLEGENSLIHIMKLNGFNVQLAHDKKENGGIIIVFIAEKPVKKNYATLTFTYKNIEYSKVIEFSKKFGWQKIKNRMNGIK